MRENKPRITIEVDQEIKQKFSEKAKSEGRTMKWLIIQWIKDFLKR